jgi:hypothetical protein
MNFEDLTLKPAEPAPVVIMAEAPKPVLSKETAKPAEAKK